MPERWPRAGKAGVVNPYAGARQIGTGAGVMGRVVRVCTDASFCVLDTTSSHDEVAHGLPWFVSMRGWGVWFADRELNICFFCTF